MTTGAVVLLVSCALALALGGYRLLTDGRFRGTHTVRGIAPEAEPHELTTWDQLATAAKVGPGERATLVQFSSAFCAPCRATRRTLHEVAELVPGVVHVEIDAEHHLEVVRALGILRTPTTIVVDADGHEVTRATGAPTKQQVLVALTSASA